MPSQTVLPRWRGFNLLEMFRPDSQGRFDEQDFRWIAEWGFDFVRLPMDYRRWTGGDDLCTLREDVLAEVDRAMELGRRYGLHVCLSFHRAPGYCVAADPPEQFNLWKDASAQETFCHHWRAFARRYRGIPSSALSFNLVNEPGAESDLMSREDHRRVIAAGTAAVREIDPDRLVIADGLFFGNLPAPELSDLHVAQSCRAYWPMEVTHYKASWVSAENWPTPSWPMRTRTGVRADRAWLERHYAKWAKLADSGVGVHCGEAGAYSFTPHDVFLRWLGDVLEILASHNIGWALWNLRGAFGVLDSQRADVEYQDFHGHALDGKLLELLRAM